MMNFRIFLAAVTFLALLTGIDRASAQEKAWTLSSTTTFASKYIWRGQKLAGTASMQPSLTFGYKGLAVSSWSNFAHTGFGDSGVAGNHWTEHDLTVNYGFALGDKVAVNAGWIGYAFPNFTTGRYTNEIYGKVGLNTFLKPTFAAYGDVHNGDGMYYNLGIAHSVPLPKKVAMNLSASAGLNQKQWIPITTISDVILGVSFDLPVNGNVIFSPFYNYITGNDSLRTCVHHSGCIYYTGSIVGVNMTLSR